MDRLTDQLDMTIVVDWAVKPQHKQIIIMYIGGAFLGQHTRLV